MPIKIAINRSYGGFGLSDAAYRTYCDRLKARGDACKTKYELQDEENRADPDLIALIEDLGTAAANGSCTELVIVEIPDDVAGNWCIKEYDGIEWVAENHRTWPEP